MNLETTRAPESEQNLDELLRLCRGEMEFVLVARSSWKRLVAVDGMLGVVLAFCKKLKGIHVGKGRSSKRSAPGID